MKRLTDKQKMYIKMGVFVSFVVATLIIWGVTDSTSTYVSLPL